jgi:hypothetical protein
MAHELSSVELYWLPLGAGGHSVRLNGRVYEAVIAGLERRPSCWPTASSPMPRRRVASPQLLTEDPTQAEHLLDLVPHVPTPVWGRDELDTGEMWNSNSLISWLIARSGLDAKTIKVPVGGRAPGWDAGLVVARRHKIRTPTPADRRASGAQCATT